MRKPNSGECAHCGTWRRSLHRDHIVPKFKGGGDEPENIQNLCANCHEDKTREDLLGSALSPSAKARQSAAQLGKDRSHTGPAISAGMVAHWADPAKHAARCEAASRREASKRESGFVHTERRFICGGCDLVTTGGPLTMHQRSSGHEGRLPEGQLL